MLRVRKAILAERLLLGFITLLAFPFRWCKTSALRTASISVNTRDQQQTSQKGAGSFYRHFTSVVSKPVIKLCCLNIFITVYSVCTVGNV